MMMMMMCSYLTFLRAIVVNRSNGGYARERQLTENMHLCVYRVLRVHAKGNCYTRIH